MRLTTVRRAACRAFFNTDFDLFFLFTGVPWGIQCSFFAILESARIADPSLCVNFAVWWAALLNPLDETVAIRSKRSVWVTRIDPRHHETRTRTEGSASEAISIA